MVTPFAHSARIVLFFAVLALYEPPGLPPTNQSVVPRLWIRFFITTTVNAAIIILFNFSLFLLLNGFLCVKYGRLLFVKHEIDLLFYLFHFGDHPLLDGQQVVDLLSLLRVLEEPTHVGVWGRNYLLLL